MLLCTSHVHSQQSTQHLTIGGGHLCNDVHLRNAVCACHLHDDLWTQCAYQWKTVADSSKKRAHRQCDIVKIATIAAANERAACEEMVTTCSHSGLYLGAPPPGNRRSTGQNSGGNCQPAEHRSTDPAESCSVRTSNTVVFLRRPDVPGFCPSIGWVRMVMISTCSVTARGVV